MKRTISTIEPQLGRVSNSLEASVLLDVRDFQKNSKDVRHLASEFLTSETNQIGAWDHRNVRECENGNVLFGESIYDQC